MLKDLIKSQIGEVDALKQKEHKILELVGLFTGLFTFVSIQFQLLTASDKFIILPLSMLLLGGLLLAMTTFMLLINQGKLMMFQLMAIVVGLFLVVAGVGSAYGYRNNTFSEINAFCRTQYDDIEVKQDATDPANYIKNLCYNRLRSN